MLSLQWANPAAMVACVDKLNHILEAELSQKRRWDLALLALGLAFTFYFLFSWLFLPSSVHVEFIQTANDYLLKPEDGFFAHLIDSVFNLQNTEHGYYRPRALCFLIQYIENFR